MREAFEIPLLRATAPSDAEGMARALCEARDSGARAILVDADAPAAAAEPMSLLGREDAAGERLWLDEALALLGGTPLLAIRLVASEAGAGAARADAVLATLERAGSPSEVVVLDREPEILERIKARAPLLTTGLIAPSEPVDAARERALACAATVLLLEGPPPGGEDVREAERRGLVVWSAPAGEARVRAHAHSDAPDSTGRGIPAADDDAPRVLVLDRDDERVAAALLHPDHGLERAWEQRLAPGDTPREGDGYGARQRILATLLERAARSSPRTPVAAACLGPPLEAGSLEERPTVGDHGRVPWGPDARVPLRVRVGRSAASLIGAAGPHGDRILVYVERDAEVLRGRPAPSPDGPEGPARTSPLWTTEGRGPARVHLRREVIPLPDAPGEGLDDPRDERARALARRLVTGDTRLARALEALGSAARGVADPRDRTILLGGPGSRVPQLPHRLREWLPLEPLVCRDPCDLAWTGAARLAAAAARVPWSYRPEIRTLR
jgi:hypothetical protein